jgi:hypothetical protein
MKDNTCAMHTMGSSRLSTVFLRDEVTLYIASTCTTHLHSLSETLQLTIRLLLARGMQMATSIINTMSHIWHSMVTISSARMPFS